MPTSPTLPTGRVRHEPIAISESPSQADGRQAGHRSRPARCRCSTAGEGTRSPLLCQRIERWTQSLLLIKGWLRKDDSINLGGVLQGSDIIVIDIDGPQGEAAWSDLGVNVVTRETQTGKGRHLYFRDTLGRFKSNRIAIRPALDVLTNGYVLLPKSVHPSGGRYLSSDFSAAIADLPDKASRLLVGAKGGQQRVPSTVIGEGERNAKLTSLAGAIRRQGFGQEVILQALVAVNRIECDPPLERKEVEGIARSISGYAAESDDLFPSMADVIPADVEFLWEPYFVRGAVNFLEGDPNVGKTYLLCKIAADVSAGRRLPGQSERPSPQHVIFLSAEDSPEFTLQPRLNRMKADLENVTYLAKYHLMSDQFLSRLQAEIINRKAGLVIFDPFVAFMEQGRDMNKSNQTRPFMAKLAELARATGAALIALRHITKGDKTKAIYSGLGSIDIVAAAHSAVMVGIDPSDPELRIMAHSKFNLSLPGASIAYRLEDGDRSSRRLPVVRWAGHSNLSADDLVGSPRPPGRPDDSRQHAAQFLSKELSQGPTPAGDLIAKAERNAKLERTLRRAADELGVLKHGGVWQLPPEGEPERNAPS